MRLVFRNDIKSFSERGCQHHRVKFESPCGKNERSGFLIKRKIDFPSGLKSGIQNKALVFERTKIDCHCESFWFFGVVLNDFFHPSGLESTFR